MKRNTGFYRRGSAAIGLIVFAIIILGSVLSLTTSAVISVSNTSRALEVARQNVLVANRLELATREAAQAYFGVSLSQPAASFEDQLNRVVGAASFGSVTANVVSVSALPARFRLFPDMGGAPAALGPRSAALELLSSPALNVLCGDSGGGSVCESSSFTVQYRTERPGPVAPYAHALQVECRLVGVPLTRHGLTPYELPARIGELTGSASWPTYADARQVAPLGLAGSRDPANVAGLASPSDAIGENRPGHFRYLAALSDAYQYTFSDRYLQRVADYAGRTHFVQIGAGSANPVLEGGVEVGTDYTLDVGLFGRGTFGPKTETRSAAVFYSTGVSGRLILRDNGSGSDAVLLVVAGPGGVSPVGRLELRIETDLVRPVVIVSYNVEVSTAGPRVVNGALLLDQNCRVSGTTGPITTGHVSYSASGEVNPDAFRLQAMSEAAEALAPRVVYVASSKAFL
jgi:hypothetical protein